MDLNDTDTDTLLALVSSLLVAQAPNPDTVLDALVRCNGDIEATAQLLNDDKGKKRKRVDLAEWLNLNSCPSKISKRSSVDVKEDSNTKRPTKPTKPHAILGHPSLKTRKTTARTPPLILSNPSMVARHLPCTFHLSVLPLELACRLFHTMSQMSQGWKRNKWWLFNRMVESPHRTAFFVRKDALEGDTLGSWQEAAQYWYNGQKAEPPETFPPDMEDACKIIERIVNEQLQQRERFPLEWGGSGINADWRANVAASNCYEGSKEGVGFHSDQLTYLGPYPTIASLSLGTERMFSLREVIPHDQTSIRGARTFNIPLPHNSLTVMHASCQEMFKHSVPPQNTIDLHHPILPATSGGRIDLSNRRINITFRFYRPDFRPTSIPLCRCGVPTVLRPDMKNRSDGRPNRYWWACSGGAQNEGKGCGYWSIMNMQSEGRGPCMDKGVC